jgi:hypothetical protein
VDRYPCDEQDDDATGEPPPAADRPRRLGLPDSRARERRGTGEQGRRDDGDAEHGGQVPGPVHGRSGEADGEQRQRRPGLHDGFRRPEALNPGHGDRREEPHQQQQPGHTQLGQRLEDHRVRAGRRDRHLAMLEPVRRIAAGPDPLDRRARERVDRRLPELVPPAAAAAQEPDLAALDRRVVWRRLELVPLLHGVRDDDHGKQRRRGHGDGGQTGTTWDHEGLDPGVERSAQPVRRRHDRGGHREHLVTLARRLAGRRAVEERVPCLGDRDQDCRDHEAEQQVDDQAAPQGPGAHQGRVGERGGDHSAARVGHPERQHDHRHRADGGGPHGPRG